MNLRSFSLISLLLVLLFITVQVLADVRAERFKVNVNGSCIERIEEAAEGVEGVIKINWDKKKEELEIIYKETEISLSDIEEAIAKAGFNTPNFDAPKDVSRQLSEECRVEEAITFASERHD